MTDIIILNITLTHTLTFTKIMEKKQKRLEEDLNKKQKRLEEDLKKKQKRLEEDLEKKQKRLEEDLEKAKQKEIKRVDDAATLLLMSKLSAFEERADVQIRNLTLSPTKVKRDSAFYSNTND